MTTGTATGRQRRRVGYAASAAYTAICSRLPANVDRAAVVDGLIEGLGLPAFCDDIIAPAMAKKQQLTVFHDAALVDRLVDGPGVDGHGCQGGGGDGGDETDADPDAPKETADERFGLEYDCPAFDGMSQYVRAVAGTTIACARYLDVGGGGRDQRVAINWHGGRHHARRARCAGFCYVNDIVLGILELRKHADRVLYVDFDLHHGDGVDTAFTYSPNVLCLSVHRFDRGFYPGTGGPGARGKGRGTNYSVNLPTRQGLGDESLAQLVADVVLPTLADFDPQAVVVQCGADGLARDPCREWNLSVRGLGDAILQVVDAGRPTLLLGGGGYRHDDVARCYAYVTARVVGQGDAAEGWTAVPDSVAGVDAFRADGFEFWTGHRSRMADDNAGDYLAGLVQRAAGTRPAS
ncbi:histone deacetylase [Dipodascopsis tothii]|uniref:histone deacetylase n=1 Tax=Dipodascopsis tothii TaxID=44089 RepID=UPI0034CDFDB2